MKKFSININNKIFDIEKSDDNKFIVNNKVFEVERIKEIGNNFCFYKVDGKTFVCGIKDLEMNKYVLNYNNRSIEGEVIDSYVELIQKYIKGSSSSNNFSHLIIKAPMPGLVVKILKKIGDTVQKGEPVLIIEAMKMENSIKSNVNGTITTIKAEEGKPVVKNQMLVEIEIAK
jgi:biotin carboxyl carrier protein